MSKSFNRLSGGGGENKELTGWNLNLKDAGLDHLAVGAKLRIKFKEEPDEQEAKKKKWYQWGDVRKEIVAEITKTEEGGYKVNLKGGEYDYDTSAPEIKEEVRKKQEQYEQKQLKAMFTQRGVNGVGFKKPDLQTQVSGLYDYLASDKLSDPQKQEALNAINSWLVLAGSNVITADMFDKAKTPQPAEVKKKLQEIIASVYSDPDTFFSDVKSNLSPDNPLQAYRGHVTGGITLTKEQAQTFSVAIGTATHQTISEELKASSERYSTVNNGLQTAKELRDTLSTKGAIFGEKGLLRQHRDNGVNLINAEKRQQHLKNLVGGNPAAEKEKRLAVFKKQSWWEKKEFGFFKSDEKRLAVLEQRTKDVGDEIKPLQTTFDASAKVITDKLKKIEEASKVVGVVPEDVVENMATLNRIIKPAVTKEYIEQKVTQAQSTKKEPSLLARGEEWDVQSALKHIIGKRQDRTGLEAANRTTEKDLEKLQEKEKQAYSRSKKPLTVEPHQKSNSSKPVKLAEGVQLLSGSVEPRSRTHHDPLVGKPITNDLKKKAKELDPGIGSSETETPSKPSKSMTLFSFGGKGK